MTFAPSSLEDTSLMALYSAIASFDLDLRPELAPTILAKEILLTASNRARES